MHLVVTLLTVVAAIVAAGHVLAGLRAEWPDIRRLRSRLADPSACTILVTFRDPARQVRPVLVPARRAVPARPASRPLETA